MKKKVINAIICLILAIIFSIIIFAFKGNIDYYFLDIYLLSTIYLGVNYFNDKEFPYLRQLYTLYGLITTIYILCSFSILSIIISLILTIIIVGQYYYIRRTHEEVIEIKEEPKPIINVQELAFEEDIKKIYIQMQEYFMNFDYENLANVLMDNLYNQYAKQMHSLEKNNKKAIRKVIEILDYKVLEKNNKYAKVNINVIEDKHTKTINQLDDKEMLYESFYEISLVNCNGWKIKEVKLLYCHSYKKS